MVEAVVPEPELEAPVVEAAALSDLDLFESGLEGSQQANFQEKVEFVEGIGPTYGMKLNEAGIETVMDLLRRGATRKGRAELVEATGIANGLIMKWINAADLYRVKGIGKQFGELLEAAGVDTVPELAQRNPLNLYTKLSEVNAEKKIAGRAPHQSEVESWVAQAKDLPRVIEY
jgi:predicted flap endonuclease-1-like 5' DNA nuclease